MNDSIYSSNGWHAKTLDGTGMALETPMLRVHVLLDRMELLGDRIQILSKILEYLSEI
jgi:hypothetical protein